MGLLIYLYHYEIWLIWVVMLLALGIGRVLSGIVKKLSKERRRPRVGVKFKWVPIIGEILVDRKRIGRFVFNRYAKFEFMHTLLWVLMYQKFGATFWLLFGLPIVSVLLMMVLVLRQRRRIPISLNAVLGLIVVLMVVFDKEIPHISVRVTRIEHVFGILIGLMLYPMFYINNGRKNDSLVFDLVLFSAIVGFMFGWMLMFLTVTTSIVIILFFEIYKKIRLRRHKVSQVDFGTVLIGVVIIFMYLGLDLVEFYLRLI